MRLVLPILASLALTCAAASAATAQTPPPTAAKPLVTPAPELVARVDGLIPLLNGGGDFDTYFAPIFRAAITPAQMQPLIAQLAGLYGKAAAIAALEPMSPWSATVRIGYERGTVTARIAVDPAAPHQVTGLRITGSELTNDSISKLDEDFGKLAGSSGYGIYALGKGEPVAVHESNGDRAAPLGSAFKLWILAEAARQVAAGERTWSDVVPVGAPSLPSGILQTWPAATPMTLQALATLMISISDNTASDTLLDTLGRAKVDAMAARLAPAQADRNTPVLKTREMMVLKGARTDLGARWAAAGPAGRRALLADNAAVFSGAAIDTASFQAGPVMPDTVEWFGTPRDEARALDWLRLHGGATALAILAVSPGIQQPIKDRFAYLGFKGGSEPGVITLNYLVRDKAGRWFAVVANWHRGDGLVETVTFSALVDRAVRLAGKE
jgi:beta-lactamase class A